MKYEAIVIGCSAGGLFALLAILSSLPADYSLPIIIVQHRSKEEPTLLEEVLSHKCRINIRQADEKEPIKAGVVYFAPPDYHLLVEEDHSFSLSFEPPVNFSRPSIDVLFETAAAAFKKKLLGIILTGASRDGADGIRRIRHFKGTTVAQDPASAHFPFMPQSAIDTGCVQHILDLKGINDLLLQVRNS
jgi:two-component system, chemotaxis family, protein-glutamate methylesterase/glutaminase